MSTKNSMKYLGAFIVAGMLFHSTAAWAGFQWSTQPAAADGVTASGSKSPLKDTAAEPIIIVAPTPVDRRATRAPEVVAPVILGDTPTSAVMSAPPAAPSPVLSNVKSNSEEAKPLTLMEADGRDAAPVSPAPSEAAAAPQTAAVPSLIASSDVVQGFADHVPLTVALRQILPPAYSFSVDHDVDMGVMVSFKGGKPWRATLADALSGAGLGMSEQARMVVVSRLDQVPASQSTTSKKAPLPLVAKAADAPDTAAEHRLLLPVGKPVVPPAVLPPAKNSVPEINIISDRAPDIRLDVATPDGRDGGVSVAPQVREATIGIATVDTWAAERGDSLRKILGAWSRRAGVEVEWLAEYDYPLQASVDFKGTYEAAVRALLTGFEAAHPQPVAQLHANANVGQKVLVVRARGNSNKD